MYTLELEKLTEEQLEAFKIIDKKAVEAEIKRREETIYSPEDLQKGQVYADLYKAYFYIKPMYDNMRNTDVKKTITQSEVLPVMEKIFRWADHNKVAFEKFKGEPQPQPQTQPQTQPETKEEAIVAKVRIPLAVGEPGVAVVAETVVGEPTWEPGGGAEVEQPIPAAKVIPLESKPEVIPMTVEEPKVPVEEVLSPVESMTQQKLNEILATIPAVEKI